MSICAKIIVAIACVLPAACASVPTYQSAPAASPAGYRLGPATGFANLDHLHRFINDDQTIIYFQNQGGGGVATGVLFGPLGVAANMAMIKSQTEKDAEALKGKVAVDVVGAFSGVATSHALVLSESPDAVLLSRYLLVEKLDDKHVRFAALLIAGFDVSGQKSTRQYVYELTDSYDKDKLVAGLAPDQLSALTGHLTAGFDWDLATLAGDVSGQLKPGAKGTVRSEFITPRITFELMGYRLDGGTDRVGFTTVSAHNATFYSLPVDEATIKN